MDPKLLASGSDDAKGTIWISSAFPHALTPNLIPFISRDADIY